MTFSTSNILHSKTCTLRPSIKQHINNAKNKAINASHHYTNEKFNEINPLSHQRFKALEETIHHAEKRLNAGIASVTAMASIPYVAENLFSYGVGLGTYQNSHSLAAGAQYKVSPNTNARLHVSWDSSHNTALGIGFSGNW